jgi:predicted  nucleic acid-binding Zn-ribbon protein
VQVVDGHCGSCQINLAPSMVMDLVKMKSLVTCESCQRILYMPAKTPSAAA